MSAVEYDNDVLEALEANYEQMSPALTPSLLSIKLSLENSARNNPRTEEEAIETTKKLIEDGYVVPEEDEWEMDTDIEKLKIEKFRQEHEEVIAHDPREYFTESIHGNRKFDAEKMAEEIMKKHQFLKISGKEDGLKIYEDGIWKEKNFVVEIIEREVNERLGQETSSNYRSNVKNIITNHRDIQIDEEDFKHPKMHIPFANGVYNLENKEFEDYKPEHYFTFKYNAEYRPELENKDVEGFIEDIAPESEEKRKKLHEIAALTIAPWRVKEIMPILFGKGSNGKNQFVNVLKKITGKENYHITSSKRISQDKFESATMHDAQLLFLDEFEDASSPSTLKRLTDDEQNIRGMHQEPSTIETSVQPIFAANELPNPNEDSDGFYRRWQIIDFNQKFTEKEDDDNPDKLSPTELEEKYMSKEAIDSYATSLISHLEDVIEKNKLTDQQAQAKVRAIWEEKASAVYRFIDNFLTQGKIDYADQSNVGDYIIKKELTKVVNSYLDEKNLSKTDTTHITRALEKHPDIDVNTSARPRPGDGLDPDQPVAYEGIRIRDDSVHDIKGVLPLYAWRSPELMRLTNHRKYIDITNNDKTAIALAFLKQHKDGGVNMVQLIKELNLSHNELEAINESEYVEKKTEEKDGSYIPFYVVNEEKLEEDIEDADIMVDKDGKTVRPMQWLRDEIDSWSQETRKDKEEVIQKAKATGFAEDAIESAIENLQDDGVLYEPKPNRVQKL